jgi:hypothetical protein
MGAGLLCWEEGLDYLGGGSRSTHETLSSPVPSCSMLQLPHKRPGKAENSIYLVILQPTGQSPGRFSDATALLRET